MENQLFTWLRIRCMSNFIFRFYVNFSVTPIFHYKMDWNCCSSLSVGVTLSPLLTAMSNQV